MIVILNCVGQISGPIFNVFSCKFKRFCPQRTVGNVPIYILKHYHSLVPSNGRVWQLGREMAFDFPNDDTAKVIAKNRHLKGAELAGDLAILFGPDGKQIWSFELDANDQARSPE